MRSFICVFLITQSRGKLVFQIHVYQFLQSAHICRLDFGGRISSSSSYICHFLMLVWIFLFGDDTTFAFSIELVNSLGACALNVSVTVAFLPKLPVATQHTFSVFFERDISFLCKSGDGSGSFVLSKTER